MALAEGESPEEAASDDPYAEVVCELLLLAARARSPEARNTFITLAGRYRALHQQRQFPALAPTPMSGGAASGPAKPT